MAGFALAASLSIYPTIRFVSWRKSFAQNQVPEISEQEAGRIKLLLRLEMIAVAIILLSAALMAHGVGML
jgi:putative membrane protein